MALPSGRPLALPLPAAYQRPVLHKVIVPALRLRPHRVLFVLTTRALHRAGLDGPEEAATHQPWRWRRLRTSTSLIGGLPSGRAGAPESLGSARRRRRCRVGVSAGAGAVSGYVWRRRRPRLCRAGAGGAVGGRRGRLAAVAGLVDGRRRGRQRLRYVLVTGGLPTGHCGRSPGPARHSTCGTRNRAS